MMKKTMTMLGAALAAASVMLTGAAEATTKCRATVIKESAKITQALAKIYQKCEEGVAAGKLTGPCPDGKSAGKISGAKAKTAAAVDKACADAPSTGEFNFGSCPNAQGPNGATGCSALVTSKASQGACLACLAEEHAAENAKVSYGSLADPMGNKAVKKCQLAIGKNAGAYFIARSKALQKCEDGKLKGKLPSDTDCATEPGASAAIAKAQSTLTAGIGKACGGADKAVGGGDDLAVASIGFPAQCPPLQAGFAPGNDVTDVAGVLACVQGQADDRSDCTNAAALPGDTPALPGKCSASATSCSTDGGAATVQVSVTNTSSSVDPIGGVTISLGYRDVTIPGTGSDFQVLGRVNNLTSGFLEASDGEDALKVAITDFNGIPAGAVFEVAFDTCAGAPTAADFGCVVTQASSNGETGPAAEILDGVSCTAAVL